MTEHSPVVKSNINPMQMDFYHALKLAVEGSKIHKLEWQDKGHYGFFQGEQLMLHKPDDTIHTWIVRDADVLGEDWITI